MFSDNGQWNLVKQPSNSKEKLVETSIIMSLVVPIIYQDRKGQASGLKREITKKISTHARLKRATHHTLIHFSETQLRPFQIKLPGIINNWTNEPQFT